MGNRGKGGRLIMWALLTYDGEAHAVEFFKKEQDAVDSFILWLDYMRVHKGLAYTNHILCGIANRWVEQQVVVNGQGILLVAKLMKVENGAEFAW